MTFTIYARKEPTTDDVLLKYAPGAKKFDVVLYADREGKLKKGTYRWDLSSKPTRRNKFVNFNCFRYRLEWI